MKVISSKIDIIILLRKRNKEYLQLIEFQLIKL